MLRILFVVIAIIGWYLMVQPSIWVVADVPPIPACVVLQSREGVRAFDEQIAYRGVSFGTQTVEQKLGMTLSHPVTVVLAPDAKTYAKILVDEQGISPQAALAHAAFTSGSTQAEKVIVNIGDIELYNDALFIVAHEIAHQCQLERSSDSTRLTWLTEGLADWVAAHAVAANLGEPDGAENSQIDSYCRAWLSTLARSEKYPALRNLDLRTDWLSSLQTYGPVVPYRTSALAVFRLADLAGPKAFRSFFDLQRKGELPENAFANAFGITLDNFEKDYALWLEARVNKH